MYIYTNVLWYSRMAGFRRREIEYMQALCIYDIYIECYSVSVIIYPISLCAQKSHAYHVIMVLQKNNTNIIFHEQIFKQKRQIFCLNPFYIVTYYINWAKTSWTDHTKLMV